MAKRKELKSEGAAIFNEDAYERELQSLREKHTIHLRQAISDAREKRDQAQGLLDGLERQLAKIEGRELVHRSSSGRMRKVDKLKYEAEALEFLQTSKDGVSRSQVAERFGVTPAQAATILRGLLEAKKIKREGSLKNARYFAVS
jgi:DNA-binding MarR family transcriptional regulator